MKMVTRIILLALLALLTANVVLGSTNFEQFDQKAELDRVHALPGTDNLDFDLYAGYITVDVHAGRALFYTLAESSSPHPNSDPLVLWLNGGPGCSSLGGGFMSELGPFYPTPNGVNLVKNDYSWNNVANMLFLESPAFVGWSYSNTSSDAVVGDGRTARDSYEFLLQFVQRFPKYADRPLWLAGESYAGHYLPNLALEILKGNSASDSLQQSRRLNFKGFLLGNPLTLPEVDSAGALQFWFSHGIISATTFEGAMKYCDLAAIEPLLVARTSSFATSDSKPAVEEEEENKGSRLSSLSRRLAAFLPEINTIAATKSLQKKDDDERCDDFINQAMEEMGGINIYDVYADVCLENQPAKSSSSSSSSSKPFLLKQPRYDPCIDNEVEIYMNRPDVQAALHANSSGNTQPGPWVTCTPRIDYSREDLLSSMLPVYAQLLNDYKIEKIEMLIYSGDLDAIVPIIGTRRWIQMLDLEVEEKWRPWRSSTLQVGGWTVKHEGLTFASVRGAGHMVPYTQPERAFYLFSQWVHGKPL